MKNWIVLLLNIGVLLLSPVWGQTGFIQSISGKKGNADMVPLENTQAENKNKTKAGGFGGNESLYQISGERSLVKFSVSDSLTFIVSYTEGMQAMPMGNTMIELLKLYKFDSKNGIRTYTISKVGPMGTGIKEGKDIKCDYKKEASGRMLIIPKKTLEPGQYAFINMGDAEVSSSGKNVKYTVFAFSIE